MQKSSIQEKKIRVNFLPADPADPAPATTPSRQATVNGSDAPPAYNSPSSPTQVSSTPPTSKPESKQVDAVAASTAAPLTSSTTMDDVKSQLKEAQQTISRLTDQLKEQEQGLRRRAAEASSKEKEDRSTTNTSSLSMEQVPTGVAVPMVAGLCLLSFLIAYLFF